MLVGQNWKDYFDVVIVQARKPRFFTDDSRPFRVFDTKTGTHLWDRVSRLDREKTYFEGTVKQLQELKGWSGHEVLYFGTSISSPSLICVVCCILVQLSHPRHSYLYSYRRSPLQRFSRRNIGAWVANRCYNQWIGCMSCSIRAIIWRRRRDNEWKNLKCLIYLQHEIETLNDPEFKTNANWLQMLTQLIEDYQDNESDNAKAALKKWNAERDQLRYELWPTFWIDLTDTIAV